MDSWRGSRVEGGSERARQRKLPNRGGNGVGWRGAPAITGLSPRVAFLVNRPDPENSGALLTSAVNDRMREFSLTSVIPRESISAVQTHDYKTKKLTCIITICAVTPVIRVPGDQLN